jgi:hypothetical protein
MTTRELLHEMVDELREEDLITAARILKGLELAPHPADLLLANAPDDDEPFDPAVLDDDDDEPAISHDEAARRLRETS